MERKEGTYEFTPTMGERVRRLLGQLFTFVVGKRGLFVWNRKKKEESLNRSPHQNFRPHPEKRKKERKKANHNTH